MKKFCCILLLSLLIVIGTGCGQKSSGTTGNIQTTIKSNEVKNEDSNNKKEKYQIYFSDPQLEKLEQAEYELSFSNSNEKYKKVFEALQDSSNPERISLWNRIELVSLFFDKNTLALNIHIPDDARLGADGEQLAIEVLKKTFFQFDEVKSIDLLVDGKRPDSLMGHIDLTHPIKRDNP